MAGRIPLVDLAAEYAEAGEAIEDAVLRCLRSGAYVLGPETTALERELAELVGAGFAVGVGSGTEALTLSLRALDVGPGHEVVTSVFTYFATVEAILACGARPVFVDIEPGSFSIDPGAVAAALSERTRAVIPVHLFGRCADMERIAAVTRDADVPVVEDAAQAVGAGRGGQRAGSWGATGCFSFYPSKNLGAAGDGGCITTSDASLAERLRLLRSHGLDEDGRHVVAGTTSRLDALQAAVLRAKLPYLKAWGDDRARNARIYGEELSGIDGIELPTAATDEQVVWNQYTIRCRDRERIQSALDEAGIEARRYYARLACEEPALGEACAPADRFPEAARARDEVLSIPVRPSCDPDTIRRIARVIRDAA
jgi:dTDP-4-amino-4,6-dideoxygalactose transaminase